MNMKEYIDEAEAALLHTYNRYQVVLDKGDGVNLYDIEGRKYLDFVSGIAVFALGYNNKEYNDAFCLLLSLEGLSLKDSDNSFTLNLFTLNFEL